MDIDISEVVNIVSTESVDVFCKNVLHLRAVNTSLIAEEHFDNEEGNSNSAAVERLKEQCMSVMDDPYDDPAQVPVLYQ